MGTDNNLELIGQGGVLAIRFLPMYENKLGEGDKAELRLFTRIGVPDSVLQTLQALIRNAGVTLWDDVKQVSRMISIRFEKRSAPVGIILSIILGLVILFSLVVAWQLLRMTSSNFMVWLIAGGAILVSLLISRRISRRKSW